MRPLRCSAKKFLDGSMDNRNLLLFIRHIMKKCIRLIMKTSKVFKTFEISYSKLPMLMKYYFMGWIGFVVFILTACQVKSTQPAIPFTGLPTDTQTASSTVTQIMEAIHTITLTAEPSTLAVYPTTPTTFTPTNLPATSTASMPYPTWTPIPTFTPIPKVRTPAPPAECPAGGSPMSLTLEDLYTPNMQESIRAVLNARGSGIGIEAALIALTNNADPPDYVVAHVLVMDVTGDGVPDVVMDLTIPEVGSYATTAALVFTCREGAYETALFLLLSPQEGIYPAGGYQVLSVEDMNVDGIREVVIVLKVFDNRRYYILAWDGTAFTSLIEPRFDEISLQTVYFVEAYGGEGAVMDTDGDDSLELVITYSEEPIRREIWTWNGHAFSLLDK